MGLTSRLSKLRWDSSDPDRAPPPLPIPPGSPGLQTRANASASIQAAAQKLSERATSAYTVNQMAPTSPDKSLIKGAQHRRMQSLQPGQGGSRDLRSYLDGVRSGSPERPSSRAAGTPSAISERDGDYMSSPERNSATPTPSSRDPLKDTPSLRPSARPPPRAILGENTPPSATMLALQTMAARDEDAPFSDITNNPSTRSPTNYDNNAIASSIHNLTNISLALQKEMNQLNRRSKDNATDLVSLKEAANSRDEDIRRTLKDLMANISASDVGSVFGGRSSNIGLGFLHDKPFGSPPSASKAFGSLPRSASHNSLLDPGSPNPYSVEGAASVAMLEKIIREMVTREGQERLLSTLQEMLDKQTKDKSVSLETQRKLEELADFIKQKSESQALVRTSSDPDEAKAMEMMSAESLRLLHKIKDSASQSGGLSAEIKALVQNLRGEVLGMGRELGRKLDHASDNKGGDRSIDDSAQAKADIERIVNEGLEQLREQMESLIRDHSQQLVASNSSQGQGAGQDVYDAVKQALDEHSTAIVQAQPPAPDGLDRESILEAVREAYEEFKPEIELQQFGLERDEILQVLKEGLVDYQSSRELQPASGTSMDEVMGAIQSAMQDFNPPRPANELADLKDDLLASVRNCLEEFRPNAPVELDSETTRSAVMEAVKEGLAAHGPHAPRELEISRDDLFDAVKASLDGSAVPFGSFGDQVLNQLRDLVDEMKVEFKQYSAANGHDTEQVLDAVKDGLETLRAEIETYVDRAQDVTGKDEIVDVVRTGLEQLRGDVQGYCAEGPTNGRNGMMEYIKAEFEHLHEAIGGQGSSNEGDDSRPSSTSEILAALEVGFEGLKSHAGSRGLMDESNEDMMEAMKAEFDALRDAVIAGSATHKDEVLATIQGLGNLNERVRSVDGDGVSDEGSLNSVREELVHLRETLATTLLRSGGAVDKDEIIDSVREAIDGLREHITSGQASPSNETLEVIREQIESLRESIGGGLVRSGDVEPDGSLADIKARLDEIAAAGPGPDGIPTAVLEAIQGEFEQLRQSVGQTMVTGGSRADTEEILETVRLGLDDLRSHLEKKLDNPEHHMNLNDQLLDALNEGLESLKTDVSKTLEKPMDMTVNYEILDTLKDGIAALRADMDKLNGVRPLSSKGGEIVLAEAPDEGQARELNESTASPAAATPSVDSLKERMEILFAQLQIKLEAVSASILDMPAPTTAAAVPPEGIALKDDLVSLEEMIRDIQESVAAVAASERAEVENAATKEDTDAIETLLRNTKAHIEEMVLPDPSTTATKEQIEAVEAVVRTTNETIESIGAKLEENGATKADVAVVEVLIQDLKSAFEEVRESMPKAAEEGEEDQKLTKTDLDVLGIIVTDIKTKIGELAIPDPETLPSKADVEQLAGLINDFRESHDKVKESYEGDIAVTAKAFDDRRKEAEEMAENIAALKTFLEETKGEILEKVADGESGINTLGETMTSMEEKINENSAVGADVKELLETVKNEFERAHSSLEGIKVDHEQSGSTLLEKHAEHKDEMITAITEKVETCYDGLMSKYDDAQHAAEEKAKMMEEKAIEQQEILANTKDMADELKLSIDTLGTSLTAFIPSFTEATEKLAEDSKTVFNKVDDTFNRLDETQNGLKIEHQMTRDEIVKALDGISGLQGDFTEYHPRFMMSLKEILALIGTHYEHSQKLAETTQEQAQAFKSLQDQIHAAAEESKSHAESMKAQTEELRGNFTALPSLLPAPISEPAEKYDDSGVHEKLDTLVGLASEAGLASAQMERLDEIQEQVKATAAEFSAFMALQNRQITEGQESKEKEAEEVALILERRQAQKDHIESEITSLNDEKESLRAVVEALRAEKDALSAQKARLNGDVSSLQMALAIRREELHEMDAKADALERRILEGLIDHSRAMLITKQTPKPSSKKKPGRDLRTPSNASAATITSGAPELQNGHALAMKARPSIRRNGAVPNTGERRIMSLSQISRNVPSGAAAYAPVAPSLISAAGSINRSQSVKNNKLRKQSWGPGANSFRDFSLTETNKENETLSEVDGESDYSSRPVSRDSNSHSRPMSRDSLASSMSERSGAGTERRSVSYTGTESGMTYGTGSYTDGITPSTDDGRRTSYTGSYMTGTDIDRRTSFGSTLRSTVGAPSAIEEELSDDQSEEDEEEEHEREQENSGQHLSTEPAENKIVPWAPPSDSGLGTDLPTAAYGMSDNEDYFPNAKAEKV
ncbi:hypothetical protein MBLNU459_g2205t1 [Dothideomycetes sp. NU459]